MKEMKLTRTINAPLKEVWNAWTESESVKKWWGPAGFTCPVAKMDVKEGGVSLVCMQAPEAAGGIKIYNTWTFTKVVEGERLEYTLQFTDEDGKALDPAQMGLEGVPKEVPHVVTFEEKDGKTEVTIVEKGYITDEAAETSKQGMVQCFDKLEAMFA